MFTHTEYTLSKIVQLIHFVTGNKGFYMGRVCIQVARGGTG